MGIGPMAVVIQIIVTREVSASSAITPFILLIGSLGIVAGLATYGYKVMATLGHGITELTPTRAYCATVAAAFVTVASSGLGLPVSTTHIAVGAVMGVGIARGIGAPRPAGGRRHHRFVVYHRPRRGPPGSHPFLSPESSFFLK
jgi:PiT family inorganic phosphate transporter